MRGRHILAFEQRRDAKAAEEKLRKRLRERDEGLNRGTNSRSDRQLPVFLHKKTLFDGANHRYKCNILIYRINRPSTVHLILQMP